MCVLCVFLKFLFVFEGRGARIAETCITSSGATFNVAYTYNFMRGYIFELYMYSLFSTVVLNQSQNIALPFPS